MKRFISAILVLALLLTLAVIPAAQADSYATAVVKGGWLRLRAEGNSESDTISAYYTGTKVTVLGGSGEWYRVLTPDGKSGYMHSAYLTITGSITGGQLDENTAAKVTSGNGKPVRLRSGPSTQYAIIATYAVGTPLTVLNTGESWCRVRINGRTGYMMSEYITTGGSIAGGYTAYVVSGNGKPVVLRAGASKSYDALATYNVGQQVTVLEYGSTWSRISVNGLNGYMMTEFLSNVKPEIPGVSDPASYTAYVTSENGKGVRLRAGAGTLYPTIATYSVGTKATVLEYGESWCRVRIAGNIGYMMTKFLTTSPVSVTLESVKVNTAAAQPGDVLSTQLSPEGAAVQYQWLNDRGESLGSGSTYTVKDSDAGRRIRVAATGTGNTTGMAVSGWVTVAQSYISRVYQLKSVTISDATPTVGQTLTATLAPAGATASISWFRDNGVFVGSGTTYTVRSADVGYSLYAWADATGDTTGEATSAQTARVTAPAATVVLQRVDISDTTPTVGDVLRAELTPANATAEFTWRSSKGYILGYGETYTVAEGDVGHSIYVYANGTENTSGSEVSGLTNLVQKAAATPLRVESVTLNDLTPVVGQVLYVALEPKTASATYTWLRDDDKILSTTSYYTVQKDDVGHSLYVWAEGANGTFGNATSKFTAPVAE